MNEQLNHIRQLINEGHVDTAISRLNDWLQTASSPTAEAYYLWEMPIGKKVTGRERSTITRKRLPWTRKVRQPMPERW